MDLDIKSRSPDCHRCMSAAVCEDHWLTMLQSPAPASPVDSAPSVKAGWLSRIDPAPAAGPVLGGRAGPGLPSVTSEGSVCCELRPLAPAEKGGAELRCDPGGDVTHS